ncbi:MAG TPA: tRNA (adenosine(37)-N6)-dimethylallyltransferase MiaA [Bacteroidia bacterium]|nr:tRNA (adenosine(37)-N6)-dimethylallyltransferase MiaA [Bacteroidia bacterium]
MNPNKKYLVVIAGPTGVGKTSLAIQLTRHYSSKIISADSRQFYKEMNIGTAKPTEKELSQAEHFFINSLSIHDNYSIGDFEKDVIKCLDKLFEENQLVFLVGGSGLYINAVLNGVDEFENVSEATKENVKLNYEQKGLLWLQQQLEKLDPYYYSTVDINNPQRLQRALEVCLETGKPYSSFLSNSKKTRNFETIKILINTDREILYDRINKRVDEMVKNGLVEEAKSLHPHKKLNALNTVGYKELFAHFDGETDLATAIDLIKQKTRNYAKRQITWFNNQDTYETFGRDDLEKIKAYLEIILQNS